VTFKRCFPRTTFYNYWTDTDHVAPEWNDFTWIHIEHTWDRFLGMFRFQIGLLGVFFTMHWIVDKKTNDTRKAAFQEMMRQTESNGETKNG
jgi:hypothetical protein